MKLPPKVQVAVLVVAGCAVLFGSLFGHPHTPADSAAHHDLPGAGLTPAPPSQLETEAPTESSPLEVPVPTETSEVATVAKVVDGDTIDVIMSSGREKIRILGIDTPETVKPHTLIACGGPEATIYARQLLTGQTVNLVADPTQDDRDRYRRLLRYVRLSDGRDYSIEAARAGMARSFIYRNKPVVEQSSIESAEREAQAAGRGLWGRCPN
jgi:micrococcal nuclease